MGALPEWMSRVMCVPWAYGGQKGVLDAPELELQMIVSHCVGTEFKPRRQSSEPQTHLSVLLFFFVFLQVFVVEVWWQQIENKNNLSFSFLKSSI